MPKTVKIVVITLALAAVVALSFAAGCVLGTNRQVTSLGAVEQAWDIIFRDYVAPSRLDAGKIAQGAIKGMVEALDDPYSAFLDPDTYEVKLRGMEGKIEGIGAYVGVKDDQMTVIAPIAGSPADRAGLRSGDVILEIDGQPTSGMSDVEAVLAVHGPSGSTVGLLVLHPDETEPVLLEIVRAEVEVSSVTAERKGDIAYIKISQFSQRTAEELEPVMTDIVGQAAGIILDLRGNPGGLLDTVLDVAGFFLEGGVVKLVDNKGEQTAYLITPNEAAVTDLPMVVLVDGYSASGSELVAGALQDYGRATIAGAQTYGKGSVNPLYPLEDGSGMHITTARWLTPAGRLIEGDGLAPDFELAEDEDAVQWALDFLQGGQAP